MIYIGSVRFWLASLESRPAFDLLIDAGENGK